jgi:hypothetical protein
MKNRQTTSRSIVKKVSNKKLLSLFGNLGKICVLICENLRERCRLDCFPQIFAD